MEIERDKLQISKKSRKMKKFIFVLILNLQNLWAQDSTSLYESSYSRNNSYCKWKDHKIEIKLKGPEKYIEYHDREYGQFVFLLRTDSKTPPIHVKDFFPSRYRFLSGNGGHCSKSLSIVRNNKLFFFLLKDNRPLRDELVFLIFNPEMNQVSAQMTKERVVDASVVNNQLRFASSQATGNESTGTVKIGQKEFTYKEEALSLWKLFDGADTRIDERMTYEKSTNLKKNFRYDDFLKKFKWDKSARTFRITTYYAATSFKTKEMCISVGSRQDWSCQQGGK